MMGAQRGEHKGIAGLPLECLLINHGFPPSPKSMVGDRARVSVAASIVARPKHLNFAIQSWNGWASVDRVEIAKADAVEGVARLFCKQG